MDSVIEDEKKQAALELKKLTELMEKHNVSLKQILIMKGENEF